MEQWGRSSFKSPHNRMIFEFGYCIPLLKPPTVPCIILLSSYPSWPNWTLYQCSKWGLFYLTQNLLEQAEISCISSRPTWISLCWMQCLIVWVQLNPLMGEGFILLTRVYGFMGGGCHGNHLPLIWKFLTIDAWDNFDNTCKKSFSYL